MRQDAFGFFFWVDRIGDTFRWKGENVSTAEVAQVLSTACESFAEVNVYGVVVAGQDGRAGMAAVSLRQAPSGVGSDLGAAAVPHPAGGSGGDLTSAAAQGGAGAGGGDGAGASTPAAMGANGHPGAVDWSALYRRVSTELPSYAQPLFIRVRKSVGSDLTTTFKLKKSELQSEGFDPAAVQGDELYWRDVASQAYVPLGVDLHAQVVSGAVRL